MDRKNWVLVATILGSGMVVLDGFVVNLALPSIQASFHAKFSDLQWIVDGFLLSLSALILIGGSLGDIYGRKKIYLIGLFGFTAVSLVCTLAPNSPILIAARVIQGVFGALLVPNGLAIINTNFPKKERGRAIGKWSAWLAIVIPIGPVFGGFLINVASWRWIFLINLPLGFICGYLATKYFKDSQPETARRLDVIGSVLAVIFLAGLTYGLIEGPVNSWAIKSVIALIISTISLLLFIWRERSYQDPIVRFGLFKSRNFSGSNLMTFLMYGALGGFSFILPIYMQTKLGYSAFVAGLSMLPISVLLLTLSSRVGAISAKIGPRLFISVGPLISGLAIISLLGYSPGDSFSLFLIPRTLLFGVGMALLVAPLTSTVMSSVGDEESGIASGINNAVARVAGLVTIALLGIAGQGNIYRFTIVLCAVLAGTAGVVAYITIQNQPKPTTVKN